jgi:hypothetical protein
MLVEDHLSFRQALAFLLSRELANEPPSTTTVGAGLRELLTTAELAEFTFHALR